MNNNPHRIVHLKGTPAEIGIAAGRRLGSKLEENISYYIQRRAQSLEELDLNALRPESVHRFRTLPVRFQEELEGLAKGAGISVQRVAEWITVEQYMEARCSGFINVINEHAWIGRNNDFLVPEVFGFVTIKEITNRIPTITFGMEGDVFSATGINQAQIWIHSQYSPASDTPRMDRAHLPGYVLLPEALETCSDIHAVEELLNSIDRDNGEIWFIVDGKTDEFVIIECGCRDYIKRDPVNCSLCATNHMENTDLTQISESSLKRLERLKKLVVSNSWDNPHLPDDIVSILADDAIEQRDNKYVTVESMVSCPAEMKIWYTLGGYPAASNGYWSPINWPW